MSLRRALTKHMKRPELQSLAMSPLRTMSVRRKPAESSIRDKISGPVALVSTTNMLSYNAPDLDTLNKPKSLEMPIYSLPDVEESKTTNSLDLSALDCPDLTLLTTAVNRSISSSSSNSSFASARSYNSSSGDDSDDTAATSVHDSDFESTPPSSGRCSPKQKYLDSYFEEVKKPQTVKRASSVAGFYNRKTESTTTNGFLDAPTIPRRALSHSKRAHEHVARKRSIRQMSSLTAIHDPAESDSRFDADMLTPSLGSTGHIGSSSVAGLGISEHPFGKELAQLKEVVEQFHEEVDNLAAEDDELILKACNLAKFDASDYIVDVETCYEDVFGEVMDAQMELSGWF